MFKSPYEKEKPIPQRDVGYYWAKLTETSFSEVIYWTGKKWKRIAVIYDFCDDEFFFIGEKIKE